MDQTDYARYALIAVALRLCGHPRDLHSGGDPVLTLVLGALQQIGLVERFEHHERASGIDQVDYVGLRFTQAAEPEIARVAQFLNQRG